MSEKIKETELSEGTYLPTPMIGNCIGVGGRMLMLQQLDEKL